MAGQPLPARWAGHLQVWYSFRDSLRELHVPLAPDLAAYQDPLGPQPWGTNVDPSWRVQAIGFLGEKLVNTGVSVDFGEREPRVVTSGWGGDSTNVEIRLVDPSPEQLDEALGYTAALIGLLPDLSPCQPIGCDAGIHLPGCMFAGVDT